MHRAARPLLSRPRPSALASPLLTTAALHAQTHRSCLPALLLPLVFIASATFATVRTKSPPSSPSHSSYSHSRVGRPSSAASSSDPVPDGPSMAWMCSGSSNEELLDRLAAGRIIETSRVREAMGRVDRACFCPTRSDAYMDSPQYLGYGATISAPHMHAMALELLSNQLQPGKVALDVGSGSGYLVAAMAELIAPKKGKKDEHAAEHKVSSGETKAAEPAAASAAAASSSSAAAPSEPVVFGIEHIEQLVQMSKANLAHWDPEWHTRISVAKGDGRLGIPGRSFDAIHVGAAADVIPPALLEQLRPGGRLVIPVGPAGGDQVLKVVDKGVDGKLHQRVVTGVRYVPLTSASTQLREAF